MLHSFTDWANQVPERFIGSNVDVWVTEGEKSENPSARLDIDTPTAVARITYWESGDYDAEIIDLESEHTVFSERGRFNDRNFSERFSPFFEALGFS